MTPKEMTPEHTPMNKRPAPMNKRPAPMNEAQSVPKRILSRGSQALLCACLAGGLAGGQAVAQAAPAPAGNSAQGSNSALPPSYAPSYVLSPDDQIEITVLGHPEFNAAETLLPDGTFNYPVLGKVHAAGQTVDTLTRTLTRGLGNQLNQPAITVSLKQGRARKVTVVGDGVRTAGQYDFKTGMHLLDLLAIAGGPAAAPQLVSATLETQGGATVSVDLSKLLAEADTAQNLPLAPGDVLFLVARNPEVGQVQVVGSVVKPGAYSIMPSGISVLALLNEAGGALPTARLTQVQIMHGGRVQTCNLRPLLTTDLNSGTSRLRIVPGDVLLVPENKNRILALGEVRTPGVLPIPEDQPLRLSTAYALVGGATPDGDKKSISIIRRDPAGKPVLMAVNMEDLLKGKSGVTDFVMQPDDILFIQTRNHPVSLGSILGGLGTLSVFGNLSNTFTRR